MKPDEKFIAAETLKQELFVSRKIVLEAVKLAGLQHALLSFVQRSADALIRQGADAATIRKLRIQDFDSQFFYVLPPQAFTIIEQWLGENCQPVLKNFLDQHKDGEYTARLCEYLASLRLHMLDGIPNLSGVVERAHCFLACMTDARWYPVLKAVMSLNYRPDQGAEAQLPEYYRKIRAMLDKPDLQCEQFELLLVAFSAAVEQRNRQQAAQLLKQIQMRDLELRPDMRKGDELVKRFQAAFADASAAAPSLLKTAAAHQFKDTKGLEVLAVCTKAPYGNKVNHPRFAFSRVLAVRAKDKQWLRLDEAERLRLFPETGSIIHFEGKNYPPLPKYQSYGVWRTVEQTLSPEQSERFDTRFYAAQKICPAHLVLTLEHISSTDKAMSREWIEHSNLFEVESEGERLLKFADGVFAHTIGSYVKLREEGFTQSLRAWRQLPTINLSPEVQLHVGDLPATELSCDLVRPVKGLVSAMRQLEGVSAQESAKFADAIDELGTNQALSARLEGLDMAELNLSSEEKLSEIRGLLLQTDTVAQRVQEKVERFFSEDKKQIRLAKQAREQKQRQLGELDRAQERKQQVIKGASDSLDKLFNKRYAELREQSRELYEIQSLLRASLAKTERGGLRELEQRVAQLEKAARAKAA